MVVVVLHTAVICLTYSGMGERALHLQALLDLVLTLVSLALLLLLLLL